MRVLFSYVSSFGILLLDMKRTLESDIEPDPDDDIAPCWMDSQLPNELFLMLASFLRREQRVMLSRTCRRWHNLLPFVPHSFPRRCVEKRCSPLYFACGLHGSESLMDYFWSPDWMSLPRFLLCEDELVRCGRLVGLQYFYKRCEREIGSPFLSVRTKALANYHNQEEIRQWAIEKAKAFFK